jgi:hypothetical protein
VLGSVAGNVFIGAHRTKIRPSSSCGISALPYLWYQHPALLVASGFFVESWQPHGKDRSLPQLRLHRDLATMGFGNLGNDG